MEGISAQPSDGEPMETTQPSISNAPTKEEADLARRCALEKEQQALLTIYFERVRQVRVDDRFPVLEKGSKNYDAWSLKAKDVIEECGWLHLIYNDYPDSELFTTRFAETKACMHLIYKIIDLQVRIDICDLKTPFKTWKHLKAPWAANAHLEAAHYDALLSNIAPKEGESMQDYVDRAKELYRKLRAVSAITEQQATSKMLNGIAHVTLAYTQDVRFLLDLGPNLTFEVASMRLTQMERMIADHRKAHASGAHERAANGSDMVAVTTTPVEKRMDDFMFSQSSLVDTIRSEVRSAFQTEYCAMMNAIYEDNRGGGGFGGRGPFGQYGMGRGRGGRGGYYGGRGGNYGPGRGHVGQGGGGYVGHGGGGLNNNNPGRGHTGQGGGFRGRCYDCEEPGHKSAQCPYRNKT